MYRFVFRDSGEIWEIEDFQYSGKAGYWMKAFLRELKWYRHTFPENCDRTSCIACFHNDNYFGMISLGDKCVSWLDRRPGRADLKPGYCLTGRKYGKEELP